MKIHPIIFKIAPFVLLIIFSMLCYFSQVNKSITVDEFCHFPSGMYNLFTLDWRVDRETPPLIKCLPAITSIITEPKMDIKAFAQEPNPWNLGYHFMYDNQVKYRDIFQYGRCVIILVGVGLGWLIYRFATQLYGQKGGLFALLLYVFNPNIIAHSSLTTIDIGASCTMLISIYCIWSYLKRSNIFTASITGIALGIAQLSKFTALLLYPIFIIIIGMIVIRKVFFGDKYIDSNWKSRIIHVLIILLISIFVINAGYLFSGTLTPIGDFHLLSGPFKKISLLLWGSLPIPLPIDYVSGFDSQMAISEGNNPFYISYLIGEHSLDGWWYYYLIAFMIKNPLALLVILLLTIVFWKKNICTRLEDDLCIWVPVIVFFFYFSFFTHTPIGIRFLLPVFPLFFIAAGSLISNSYLRKKPWKIAVPILAIAYLIPVILTYPNYLSYFNIIAGGPGNGHYWLIDSNLDWGQDLPGLKKYMERNKIEKIKLGYFGRVDPEIYGIKYTLPNRQPEQGVYAISINFLVGKPYYLLRENPKELIYVDLNYFEKYRLLKPVEVINNTIYIFKVANNG
jgi:hypothetical protein